MKKLVILGASGFIGSHVAEQCVLAGYSPICVLRSSSSRSFLEALEAQIVESDFTESGLREVFADADVVINCIARPELHIEPELHRQVDVTLTVCAFKAAQQISVKRFIQLSTVQVYGFKRPPRPINEDYPQTADYAFNQIAQERENALLKQASKGKTELILLRPSNTVGARDPNFSQIVDVHKKGLFPMFGHNIKYSCVDTRDVGRAMVFLAEKTSLAYGCYLLKGFDTSWEHTKALLDKTAGRSSKKIVIPRCVIMPLAKLMEWAFPYGSNPPLVPFAVDVMATNTLFDSSRIEAEGFNCKYDEASMLDEYLRWIKSNQR